MNINDGDFRDLRKKLDVMGFNQTLPVLAIPLVSALFSDLIKTTECLRDTKKQVADLLEEKSCWELGVEPYKCDNARLLAECNQLHLQFLKEREDYELRICDSQRKIRDLQTDKEHLQCHTVQLQQQLDLLLSKQLDTAAKRSQHGLKHTVKKPFITTVRTGDTLPPVLAVSSSGLKCTKCNAGVYSKVVTSNKDDQLGSATMVKSEMDKLRNELSVTTEQLEFYKRKVDSRNREIRRLNDLLAGGRPPAALAKDCCYREVGALSQDIDLLQHEKNDLMAQVREYQDKMHDAMQRALRTEEDKRKLQIHLDELKEAALQVEQQANSEIEARESELRRLQSELREMHLKNIDHKMKNNKNAAARMDGGGNAADITTFNKDKRNMNERLNVLTRREEELETLNAKQKKKLQKLHNKLADLQKELKEQSERNTVTVDEEKIRLKSECDFFQKEYLRLMNKCGSETEIQFLQSQIKSKDDELRALRAELCTGRGGGGGGLSSARLYEALPIGNLCNSGGGGGGDFSNRSNDCVEAVIARVERERDCARADYERMRCERDTVREKHLCTIQMHAEELQALRSRSEDLIRQLKSYERENRDLNSARGPTETRIVLLQEDVAQLKLKLSAEQAEVQRLQKDNDQISLLNEQNERIIADYKAKLMITERQLQTADTRMNTLDSNRESNRSEVTQLRSEISALRQTFISLEHEKDQLLSQLDSKTECAYKLEYELRDCREKRDNLAQRTKELELQVEKLTTRTRQRDNELNETSTESRSLRQQIVALKASRDEAIAENCRLTDKLSDAQVEVKSLQKKLGECDKQVAHMKQQLQQYVQEVKKAEDLLMEKDKECEELLDHYRSITHDQVVLEGNNQSLEFEAAEAKRQICEMECEIRTLKEQLHCRQCAVEDLEDKLSAARATIRCLERQLDDARDDVRMQKIDLDARKELCDKLDLQKDKLNAELNEVNDLRKKLDKECEKLRAELQQATAIKQVTTETTEQMLGRMQEEQQRQTDADVRVQNRLQRLQQQFEDTMKDLQEERDRCQQQERLANEYEQQARELRSTLNEERFQQARSREISPKVPAKTL